ncbi:MAG: hypothetical protein EP329_24485 [Deltaproteobacteria bacterium]|nr:MAG: hypothetical protein EP329_24485 [Deltaproteobacteria bacterium]
MCSSIRSTAWASAPDRWPGVSMTSKDGASGGSGAARCSASRVSTQWRTAAGAAPRPRPSR